MIYFCTIVLDGMPWLAHHLAQFEKLPDPWRWIIAEGVADPVLDTGWCKPIPHRLSTDGTTEYLNGLKSHPRVKVLQSPRWPGKTAMFNAMLQYCDRPGVLMQVDSDELWTASQIGTIASMFQNDHDCAYFQCDYRVGPNLRTVTIGAYGNNPGEWLRAWRYVPGMRFQSHEPPVFGAGPINPFSFGNTKDRGLLFLHQAYATEKQVAFKEQYYGYTGAVEQWRRLQANTKWPARLKDFLPWSDDRAMVDQVVKTT
jgi:glycosyltransferase involved in cell wall biosynthesis